MTKMKSATVYIFLVNRYLNCLHQYICFISAQNYTHMIVYLT